MKESKNNLPKIYIRRPCLYGLNIQPIDHKTRIKKFNHESHLTDGYETTEDLVHEYFVATRQKDSVAPVFCDRNS